MNIDRCKHRKLNTALLQKKVLVLVSLSDTALVSVKWKNTGPDEICKEHNLHV